MRMSHVCAFVASVAVGCGGSTGHEPAAQPSASWSGAKSSATWSGLDQGWADDEKQAFWFTSQGSTLVPYRWFLELEQAGSQTLFRDDAQMNRFGFLLAPASTRNPDALPIGFVKGRQKQGDEMLGLTCAACHTSRVALADQTVQIEGGPTLADFGAFLNELVASLEATRADEPKFQRFARKVAGEASGDKATALGRDLETFTRELAERKKRNDPPSPYGHGRVDAFGNILNEVLAHDLGVPENLAPADAPVSYPVLWDAHQHDFVQWNGSAPNTGPGPLLRNIGEVLGVFGHMAFTPRKGRFAVYRDSSVDVANLKQIESLLEKLESPMWPKGFPTIDPVKAQAGEALYATQCQACHAPIRRDDPNRRVQAHMVEAAQVGTDAVAASNFIHRTGKTGALKGTTTFVNLLQTFGDTAPAGEILRNAVFGVQLGQFELGVPDPHPLEIPPGGLPALLEDHWNGLEQKVKDQAAAIKSLLAGNPKQIAVAMYKARPLNGVWASAPYLHNGSVPTLWELLKKPGDRSQHFYVGSRQFDPVEVGFKSVAQEGGMSYFDFDTTVKGNSNAGHPYGTQLSDDQKRQLIEYLKTL